MSVDPLVDETEEPYSYTGGDPVNEIDPTGTSAGNAGSPGYVAMGCTEVPQPARCQASSFTFNPFRGWHYLQNFSAGVINSLVSVFTFGHAHVPEPNSCVPGWIYGIGNVYGYGATTVGGGIFADGLSAAAEGDVGATELGWGPGTPAAGQPPDESTIAEILEGKLGSIQRAPLPPGSPSWSDITNMTLSEIRAGAEENLPGYRTILKLLTDSRFNKP